MTSHALHQAFMGAVKRFPERIAVIEPGVGHVTYAELNALSDRFRDYLQSVDVQTGDRIGIYMRKSIDTVAAIYGILKAGAAYVPVDFSAPPARNAFIMHNCNVKVVATEQRFAEKLQRELELLGTSPSLFCVSETGGGQGMSEALQSLQPTPQIAETRVPKTDDLAYILYTSGSTGKPKGVMLSHGNAVSFVDWCSEVFAPTENDRFSSHAPFHFDLSIFDLHVSLKHGAALVLVAEEVGKDPLKLAPLIAEQRITCWYSAPSILALLAQFGKLPDFDYSALRLVLFAGEVFPVKHLRLLTEQWITPRYFNLYGPTETNVCTYFEVILPIPEDRTVPFPIGSVCSHLEGIVVDTNDQIVSTGESGELCIAGQGVMQGYWDLAEQTSRAFLAHAGKRWYHTGDIVSEYTPGCYVYQGRRDRMVKRRGYRVELGEIEAGLYKHDRIKETAVVAFSDEEAGVRIKAFLSHHGEKRPSIIDMKRFCSENLPLYMIPDEFVWLPELPKTSTDKIDYQRLKEA